MLACLVGVMRKGSLVNLQQRAGALSLSPLAMSAGPDSNPFEGLMVLREC